MMMIRRKFNSIFLGLLVASASLFSVLGPVATSPALAVGTGRHPLAEVMGEDGQPLPVGTMRTIATDIAEGIIGSSPPVDFALLSRGRVVWATHEGTGSLLIFIDMSREQRQFSVLPLPFKIKKIVADEANQRVWFLHEAFNAKSNRGQRVDCLVSFVPFDEVRVKERRLDVRSISLKDIKNSESPGDPTAVLDLKISRQGIAALTTDKGVVIFRGDIDGLYIAETTPSMIPLRRPSAQSTGFDGWSRFWTCDEGPSDAPQSRSCTLLEFDQRAVGTALFSLTLPEGMSLLGPSVGLAIPEGSSVVTSAGMLTAKMGDPSVTVFSPVVLGDQLHQPRLVVSVPNASGAAPIIASATVGPDGSLWYVDFINNCIYAFDFRTTKYNCYPLPEGSRPSKILAGSDGKVYVLARGSRRIIAITTVEMTDSEVRAAPIQTSGTADQQDVASATLSADVGAKQMVAQAEEAMRKADAGQAKAREVASTRRAGKVAKQRHAGELQAARQQARQERALARKLRKQELVDATNASAKSHSGLVGPGSATDDDSTPADATDSDDHAQETEAHGVSGLQIDWDHIAQGHFMPAGGGTVGAAGGGAVGAAGGGAVGAAGGGAAATATSTSTGVNGWLASLPKSKFLAEKSNPAVLQPLIDQAISSTGNRVYSASGNLLVFSRATSRIGRCFDLGSKQWQETSNYVVVLSPDSSRVITAYPTRASL